MYDQLLLLAVAVVAVTFVRVVRRLESASRLYLAVLAAIGAAALGAAGSGSRFLGIVAIGFAALVVVVPWLLEAGARVLFSRGKLRLAVFCAGLRATLMLGAGLGRQQEILQGLAVLERDGVDGALDHFRSLVEGTEDGGELILINEQIVSMLFYGQRWDEGIAHYEARFHPRYAAVRPALALGLLRAYGESGRIDSAAILLRAVEEGPVGSDPRALGLVSQARLTFLAYAGAAPAVARAVSGDGPKALGLSEASGALFAGIAHLRSGDATRAEAELKRVSELARGEDDRVVIASQRAMALLPSPDQEETASAVGAGVPAELTSYVETVAAKLRAFLEHAPTWRRPSSMLATGGMAVVLLLGYLATATLGQGALGWIELGAATPALVHAEGWVRVASGIVVQGDPLGTLVVLYTVWTAAPVVERTYGTARIVILGAVGGALGIWASCLVGSPSTGSVLGGANFLAVSLTVAAIWTVATQLTLGARARRRRLIPLALLLVAHGMSAVPGLLAVDVPWSGVGAAVVVGLLGVFVPPSAGRRLHAACAIVLLALVGFGTASSVRGSASDRLLALRDTPLSVGAARLRGPSTFELVTERTDVLGVPLQVQPGAADGLALRAGWLVEFVFAPPPGAEAAREGTPGLFEVDETLSRELRASAMEVPAEFALAFVEAGGDTDDLRAYRFRRNGEPVGIALERELGGGRLILLATPATAVTVGASLYAAMLADAQRE